MFDLVFYDIASSDPVRCYAPNPWKTRYALNYKKISYKTVWTDLTEIKPLRKKLGAKANRKLADGSDYFTLPLILDHARPGNLGPAIVGDSFDIAAYLDGMYPSRPDFGHSPLIPSGTTALIKAFNLYADSVWTPLAALCVQGIPFRPETEVEVKKFWASRANVERFEDLLCPPEKRHSTLMACRPAVDNFARSYVLQDDGPFLQGTTLTYADFIVAAWLQFIKATCPEFEEIMQWNGGLWQRLLDACDPWTEQDVLLK